MRESNPRYPLERRVSLALEERAKLAGSIRVERHAPGPRPGGGLHLYLSVRAHELAAGDGVEPPLVDSESAVLAIERTRHIGAQPRI